MTKDEIVKKICEKTDRRIEDFNYAWDMLTNVVESSDLAECMLRGFLTSPETLKAVFGDKDTCFLCGGQKVDAGKSFNGEVTEYNPTCKECGSNWMNKAEFPEEGNYIPAWEWHGKQMMCLDLDAILQYYEHYL